MNCSSGVSPSRRMVSRWQNLRTRLPPKNFHKVMLKMSPRRPKWKTQRSPANLDRLLGGSIVHGQRTEGRLARAEERPVGKRSVSTVTTGRAPTIEKEKKKK